MAILVGDSWCILSLFSRYSEWCLNGMHMVVHECAGTHPTCPKGSIYSASKTQDQTAMKAWMGGGDYSAFDAFAEELDSIWYDLLKYDSTFILTV